MLPDDYLRKLKQDLAEADAAANPTTRDTDPELVENSKSDEGPTP